MSPQAVWVLRASLEEHEPLLFPLLLAMINKRFKLVKLGCNDEGVCLV